MPFVRGRYHINPVLGEALEAAREAEAALAALEQAARGKRDGNGDAENCEGDANTPDDHSGPIHRVEIEAAEVVPAHTGRAQRGFVARVHRRAAAGDATASGDSYFDSALGRPDAASEPTSASNEPETHVFASHADLVHFLGQELAKDGERHAA